jgi:hypothetical protein
MLFSLFTSASLLLLGVSNAATLPPVTRNHAQEFAGNATSSPNDGMHIERNGNFVLVNQCNYDVYVWYYRPTPPFSSPELTSSSGEHGIATNPR